MSFVPVLVTTAGRQVIVAGGGSQAEWKVHRLTRTNVAVTVISDAFQPSLDMWRNHPLVTIRHGTIEASDLAPGSLVFLADEARAQAEAIKTVSEQKGAWINVVDQPAWCDFYSMAELRRGDLIVAVATSGKAPGLARDVRDLLEQLLGDHWAQTVDARAKQRLIYSSRTSEIR